MLRSFLAAIVLLSWVGIVDTEAGPKREPQYQDVQITFENIQSSSDGTETVEFRLRNKTRWRLRVYGMRGPGTNCPDGESRPDYFLETLVARRIPDDLRLELEEHGRKGSVVEMLACKETVIREERPNFSDAVQMERCFVLPNSAVSFHVPLKKLSGRHTLYVPFDYEWDLYTANVDHRAAVNLAKPPGELRNKLASPEVRYECRL